MDKVKKIVTLAALSLAVTSCSKVPPGHRGVVVDLYGSAKGIDEKSVGVGWHFTGFSQELYLFPTFLQNFSWHDNQAIIMQTKEGLTVSTDAGITYRIEPDNVVKVFQKYRLGIKEITDTFLRNMVRDAMNEVASALNASELYGDKKEYFIKRVNEIVKKEAHHTGIEVDKIYLMGTFNLPASVVGSINAKIEATQHAIRVKNEVESTRAEAEKRVIEAQTQAQRITIEAESQAKANKLLAESLTPEFVNYQAILKWNGAVPYYMGGSSPIPFIQVDKK